MYASENNDYGVNSIVDNSVKAILFFPDSVLARTKETKISHFPLFFYLIVRKTQKEARGLAVESAEQRRPQTRKKSFLDDRKNKRETKGVRITRLHIMNHEK